MNLPLWEILVPRRSNAGKPFRTRHHQNWDGKVRRISGGLTIFHPTKKGEWIDTDGTLFTDSCIPVRIRCTRKQIEKIMDITALHYDQKAVFVCKVSDETIVKEYV